MRFAARARALRGKTHSSHGGRKAYLNFELNTSYDPAVPPNQERSRRDRGLVQLPKLVGNRAADPSMAPVSL
jgi:hypothetical protein